MLGINLCLQAALIARLAMALPLVERDTGIYLSSGRVVVAGPITAAPSSSSPTIASQSTPTAFSGEPASTQTVVSTVTVHEHDTALLIVPAETYAPFTITRTLIRVASRSTYTSTVTASARPTPQPSPTALPSWSLPADFTKDFSSAFGVNRWAWGSSLVTPLPSIPVSIPTAATTLKPQNLARPSTTPSPNAGPVMQVRFPQGSVNPGASPQGGVGFYASPIDIRQANNVSFAYSVFFPADFDFVKGGKMPGLYGGHGGCSGGQQSEDCFSTRLMFRKDGMGELYLYVPKGAQSQSLCSTPPTTYCDSTYGYSIGRGAWTWKRGQWSDVRQDIWLNTPGKQDGGFNIWVNGDLVLHSHEVMYRNAVASTSSDTAKDPDAIDYLTSQALPAATAIVDSAADYDDGSHMVDDEAAPEEGLLGQVADGLLSDVTQIGGVIKRRWMKQDDIGPVQTRPRIGLVKLFSQPQVSTAAKNDTLATMSTTAAAIPSTLPANTTSLRDPQASASKSHQMEQIWITPPNAAHKYFPALGNYAAKTNSRPTTFMGMMFDTFFGGSDPSWASPREQFSYFNNVKMWVNS